MYNHEIWVTYSGDDNLYYVSIQWTAGEDELIQTIIVSIDELMQLNMNPADALLISYPYLEKDMAEEIIKKVFGYNEGIY
jgi:hypothetical protein